MTYLWHLLTSPTDPPTSTHYYESTSPPEVCDPQVSRLVVPSERIKITLQNILVHHSWLVEWSSHPHPERWIPVNLQATTENSSLSTLLDFILNLLILKKKKKKKTFFSLSVSPSLASLYFLLVLGLILKFWCLLTRLYMGWHLNICLSF